MGTETNENMTITHSSHQLGSRALPCIDGTKKRGRRRASHLTPPFPPMLYPLLLLPLLPLLHLLQLDRETIQLLDRVAQGRRLRSYRTLGAPSQNPCDFFGVRMKT